MCSFSPALVAVIAQVFSVSAGMVTFSLGKSNSSSVLVSVG